MNFNHIIWTTQNKSLMVYGWPGWMDGKCFWPSEGFHLIRILSYILLCLAIYGSCVMRNHFVSCVDGIWGCSDYDACRANTDSRASFHDLLFAVGDISSDHSQQNSAGCSGLKSVCTNTDFFCFPSTLNGFLAREDDCKEAIVGIPKYLDDFTSAEVSVLHDIRESNSSWSAAHATYTSVNGQIISCSLDPVSKLHDELPQNTDIDQTSCEDSLLKTSTLKMSGQTSIRDENSKVFESDFLDVSSSPQVAISPPLLDWGQNPLYVPSVAFLTVTNICNESILHVYEPFSTDPQFYMSDFEEMSLAPGEAASIAFVFLPRWLGLSSAHLVIQTSSGGFLIHAKGIAIDSPYGIRPLVGLDILSVERLTKSVSLHNPFDNVLFVEEVAAWITISSNNNTSRTAQAVCRVDSLHASDEFSSMHNDKEWFNVKSSELGLPLIGIRPFSDWQIDPHRTEPVIDIYLLPHIEGNVFGAFCLKLKSSSIDGTDTVIVPLEVEMRGRVEYNSLEGSVSVFLDSVMACDEKGSIAATLSLRNMASHLLSVVKISEVTERMKHFHVKYMKGLVLFPGSVTQVAVVIYTPPVNSQDSLFEISSISLDCKLMIVTNDSISPKIEIPCRDLVHRYLGYQTGSVSAAAPENSDTELEFQHDRKFDSTRTESLRSTIEMPMLASLKWKVSEIAEVDELILRNWKSHATASGFSILDDRELLFPIVQVGTHYSKWISVSNPSAKLVVMQLVLNAGAIVDQCKTDDQSLQHPLLSSFVHNDSTSTGVGFLIEETAITEVSVHPYGRALFGPIIFRPSKRCVWRSSALIRNNLSGVEWLPLQGFGGSVSLLLLEGSEPVQNLEFNLNVPIPFNVSPPEPSFHMEVTKAACSQPLSKVLYAKNTGDLPLEVRRIDVSGIECGSDGFMVHTCKGFALEPGESTRLLISFHTDFSASVVHRDLELALATGTIVIPMKASLPVYMLSLCRKSFFWTLLRKLSAVVLLAAAVTILLFCRVILQSMASTAQDYLFKNQGNSIASVRRADKSSRMHRNQRNARLFREAENSKMGFIDRYSESPTVVEGEVGIAAKNMEHMQNDEDQVVSGLHHQRKSPESPSSDRRPMAENGSYSISEAPQTSNLTVRIQKERRRRKKKPAGASLGIAGKLEVSSSQSGNSTPSSPVSPLASFTPKRSWSTSLDVEHSVEASRHPFSGARNRSCGKERVFKVPVGVKSQETDNSIKPFDNSWLFSDLGQPSINKKMTSKPVLLPSATFPGTGWHAPGYVGSSPCVGSPSSIAPNARAPGSKVSKEEQVKIEEKRGLGEEFTYDIWGNHFSEFHLMGRANDSQKVSDALECHSQSFFAIGPQSLMDKFPERSVSPTHKLERAVPPAPKMPVYAVTCLHQISN